MNKPQQHPWGSECPTHTRQYCLAVCLEAVLLEAVCLEAVLLEAVCLEAVLLEAVLRVAVCRGAVLLGAVLHDAAFAVAKLPINYGVRAPFGEQFRLVVTPIQLRGDAVAVDTCP